MTEIKGKIEKKEVFQNTNAGIESGTTWTERAVFTIAGINLGTFDTKIIEAFNVGDEVSIDYQLSKDGKYKNITNIMMLQSSHRQMKYHIKEIDIQRGTITLEEL